MELKGLKVNIEKTKVMRSGKSGGEIVKTGRWPCAVCGKGVGALNVDCFFLTYIFLIFYWPEFF